jgi:hypothetical protein
VFAEAVTLLRFAFFWVVLQPSFLLSARKLHRDGAEMVQFFQTERTKRHLNQSLKDQTLTREKNSWSDLLGFSEIWSDARQAGDIFWLPILSDTYRW